MTETEAIKQYMPIIHKMANKYCRTKNSLADYDDLVVAGQMAVIEAIRTLDESKASLTTRVFSLVRARMLIEVDSTRPYSRHHRNFVEHLKRGYKELGENATDAQLIKWSKSLRSHKSSQLSTSNLPYYKRLIKYKYGSLDRLLELPDGRAEKFIPRDDFDMDEYLIEKEKMEILNNALKSVDEKKRKIFLMRLEGQTLEEIGEQFGVTRERIRQIEKVVFDKVSKIVQRKLNER